MKKVLSFVLVLAMILSSFAMVNAASFTDVTTDDDFAGAVAVLSDLGIVNGYPDGTFGAERVVTRAEMAKFIIEALGITPAQNKGTSFPDVPYTHWAAPYVDYCQSLGIITGYGDGTFKPDQTVTYNEAIKMVVCALGYNAEALTGTYPANFVNMAMALGLLDDVQAGTAGAVRGDIAQLVYAAMDSPMVTVSKNGEVTKIQNANGVNVTMFDRHGVKPGKVVITEGMIEDAVIDLSGMLGAYAKVWMDDGDIVAVEEVKTEFYTGKLDGSDLGDYTIDKDAVDNALGYVTYFLNGEKNTTASAISAIDLDKDGKADLNKKEITVACTFDGNHIDALYSVLFWDVAENGTGYIEDEDMLEDLLESIEDCEFDLGTATFAFTDTTKDEIDEDSYELVGIGTLDDFAVGDVVEVYLGTTGEIVKIVVTRDVVTGKVTKLSSDSKEITVAGETYELYDGDEFTVTPGDEYDFYLNAAGEVVDYETVKDRSNYAVVVDTYNDNDGWTVGTTATYQVQLFTEEGKTVTYPVKKSVVEKINTPTNTWNTYAGTVVKYYVNADGEISSMAVVENNLEAKIEVKTLSAIGTIGAKKTIDGKYFASDATVIVSGTGLEGKKVEQNSDKEFDLTLSSAEKLVGEDYTTGLYIAKNGQIVYAIVDLKAEEDSTFGIYAGYAKTVDEDDVPVYELYFYVNGEKVTYTSKKAPADLPDVALTVTGEIREIELTDEKVTSTGSIKYAAEEKAKVVFINEDASAAKVKNNVWKGKSIADDAKVYVISKGEIELGDFSDLNPSKNDNKSVTLYDLDDKGFDGDGDGVDLVYDIIVITKAADKK